MKTLEIEWVGSPNYEAGREGYKPFAIFVHIECGTENGTTSWFKNPASDVSAHYSISRVGKIRQYVKEEDTAWAVGLVNNPSWKYYQKSVNPNYSTISIENEGYPKDGFTEEQIQANIWLIADIAKRWGIRVDLDTADNHQHLCGHYQLDSVNRKDCPSDKYPWNRVIEAVQNILNGNEEENDEMLREQVAALQARLDQMETVQKAMENQEAPAWAKDVIKLAQDNGILLGDEHGNLFPNSNITRAQAMVLFNRFGLFKWFDQNVSEWAIEAFNEAVELGVIHGDGKGKFDPKAPVNKEQFAVMLKECGFFEWLKERKNKEEVKA